METLNWIHVVLILFTSLFGMLIRLPFTVWKSGMAGDNMGVFSKIYGLSKKDFISYNVHDAINHKGFFPRPALFHYIVSRFPKKGWRLSSIIVNIGFDILTGWIVLFLCFKMLSASVIVEDPWAFSILGLFIFYSSPLLLPVTARLKATNNRTMGLFFATCYFLSFYYSQFGGVWPFVGLVFFGYLVIIGSTFALQALVFFTPMISVITGNYWPSLILLTTIVMGSLLPFTGVKNILTFKWGHIKLYSKNQKRSFSTKHRKFLLNTFSFFFAPKSISSKLRLFLNDAPLLILFYSVPFLFIFLKWFFNDVGWAMEKLGKIQDGSLENFCIAIGITSGVIFILTSIGKGKIFGESERYFEFSLPFLTALFIAFLEFNTALDFILVSSLIFVQIGITVLIHFLSLEGSVPSLLYFGQSDDARKVVHWLGKNEPKAHIATIPIRFGRALSSEQLATPNVRCRFYYQMITPEGKTKEGFNEYMKEVYNKNTFKMSPADLKEKYEIDHMVIHKSFLENRNPQYFTYLKNYEEIRITEDLSIYSLT